MLKDDKTEFYKFQTMGLAKQYESDDSDEANYETFIQGIKDRYKKETGEEKNEL